MPEPEVNLTRIKVYSRSAVAPMLVMSADTGNYESAPGVVHIVLYNPRVEEDGPERAGMYRIEAAEVTFDGVARFQGIAQSGAARFSIE